MTGERRIIIFAGPSLSQESLPEGLDAEIRAPASQGDVTAAVLEHKACVIGLIDGVFQGAPAVRHKELLWAMSQGATVYGAASMGALRAAELFRFGMLGRGLVFRWYRRFALAPDDAVAVLHAPAELGASAITDALIDLRILFKSACRSGIIDQKTEQALCEIAHDLHYTKRTLAAVLRIASENGLDVTSSHISKTALSQKQKDASGLLTELRNCQRSGNWPVFAAVPGFTTTDAFNQDMADAGFSLDTFNST